MALNMSHTDSLTKATARAAIRLPTLVIPQSCTQLSKEDPPSPPPGPPPSPSGWSRPVPSSDLGVVLFNLLDDPLAAHGF
ncbi:hypothetical protein P154DRAFT_581383 [Amniculicola lignicola CBS 123094]|uniref:Uncharacterized protein n=1 Tax=Amniculicola lignicola CBS 123094 TaxID=1392246 RepID=A0A6A5W6T0_9PLEO|nr:hypothetical protein P154DRAFT_581383 [Amniculicola lignicola CBS 123094]